MTHTSNSPRATGTGAADRDPLDRIEDALLNVEGSTLLLDMVVTHGQHLPSDHARRSAAFHANRLMVADVAALRRVFEAVSSTERGEG